MKILLFSSLFLILSGMLFAQKSDFTFYMDRYQNKNIMIMASTKSYSCSNYGIILRQGWSRDTLTVKIIGIDSRQNCNNIVDVANEIIQIRGIQKGIFHLRFEYEKKSNFYLVDFDGDSFSITTERSDFIMLLRN